MGYIGIVKAGKAKRITQNLKSSAEGGILGKQAGFQGGFRAIHRLLIEIIE